MDGKVCGKCEHCYLEDYYDEATDDYYVYPLCEKDRYVENVNQEACEDFEPEK